MKMKELWKLSLRSMLAVGLAVMVMSAAGCGDDDDDDDVVVIDTTPDAFTITPQTNVALNSQSTSAPITVTGINSPAPISITGTGATYAINGGTQTSTAGTVTNGQTVTVRHTNSGINNTSTTSTLNIGGVTAPFTTFTLAGSGQDITPTTFSFTPLTGTGLSRSLTSNPITVSGITDPAPIFVEGGTYSINGGPFTSNPGSVTNGQTVVVRQTSSATNNAPTTATLTIGGVSAPFTTTTAQAGGTITTPTAFTFTNMSSVALSSTVTSAPITVSGITGPAPISVSGGSYSINGGTFTTTAGTVTNGQTVTVRHNASATNNSATTTILNIGGVTAPFTSTTIAGAGGVDTTPAAFTITPQTNVALNAQSTSAPITVTGINSPAPISVTGTGATYAINGGTFTATAGTVTNGQTVTVRHTNSGINNTATTSTLNIGGVTAPFTTFTLPASGQDITPTTFSFTPLTGTALSRSLTSTPITVAGITAPAPIFVEGGTYSINGGPFTSNPGTVTNGQTVLVRQTSSATNNTPTTATLTIGGISAPFTSTTALVGGTTTTPTAFTFTNMSSVALSSTVTSAPITVSGITGPAPISVSGGSYSINSGPFVTTAGTVTNGQTVTVRHNASATNDTVTTTTLNIGGITAPFTSTTIAAGTDTTPTAFTFTPATGVALGALTTSAPITVAGINAPAPISVTGGTYSIGTGPFVSTPGTVTNAQTVRVQHNASALNNTATTTTLNIGGVTGAFTSTTVAATSAALTLYNTKAPTWNTALTCASCHRLGTLDTTGTGPDLSGTTTTIMNLRYPTPGSPGHWDIVLTAPEISALTTLFQSTP